MDESSALLSPAEEPKPLDTAVLHLSPSTRLRLDTAAILLSDAARFEWSDRPSMVDSPDLYYAFVSWNIFRRMALIATYIVLVTTALVKPAWCQQSDLCKLDSYPTMLDEEYMLHMQTSLGVELACTLVILAVLYLDFTHRGAKMKDWSSRPTQILYVRIIIAALYLLDIFLAFVFAASAEYQQWRLGGYLRAVLFIILHENTLNIWKLHVQMLPHLFEVGVLIISFLGFYAILGMNIFQKGDEGTDHFETLNSSLWTLVVLLTTSNTPQVFVESFQANRTSIIFFISFIIFGSFGLLYILMATVFSQFQMRLEETSKRNQAARRKSLHQAFLAITAPPLDANGPPPLTTDRSTIKSLLQQFSLNSIAISPKLQAQLIDTYFESSKATSTTTAIGFTKDDGEGEMVLSQSEFEQFFDELLFRMRLPQIWPHEIGGKVAAFFRRVVTGVVAGNQPWFEWLVDLLLLSNLVIFAIEAAWCSTFHEKGKTCTLDIVELFFNIFFMLELVMKVVGLGFRNFWDSMTNRLDSVATVTSSICIIVYWAHLASTDNSSILELGVALRLARCYRFLGYAPTFDLMAGVINKIGSNVKGLAGFMLTLFLIWATLGQQLLGGRICVESLTIGTNYTCPTHEEVGHTDYIKERYYDCNFNDPMLSLITLFVVMVGNDWALITDAYTDATSKFLRIYFFLWYILVVFIALNTTLSFIIDTYIVEQKRQIALALDPLQELRSSEEEALQHHLHGGSGRGGGGTSKKPQAEPKPSPSTTL